VTHTPLTSSLTSSPRQGAAASIALAPLLQGPPRTGWLLGASPAAVYLRFEDVTGPEVVAVVPPSSVRLPLGMVVAGTLPEIASDPTVVIGEGALSVGEEVWVPTRWFDPRPRSLTAANPARLVMASRVLWDLSPAEVGVDTDRARQAILALVAGEAEPTCALLGEGPGLTPAGDDVVAGALAACELLGPKSALEVVPEILARARRATTALSAALLSCAAAGQVVPEAARFLSALCGRGDSGSALAGLRSVGATSGNALAVGIVAALEGAGPSSRRSGGGDVI
jgi:hypothetical protein